MNQNLKAIKDLLQQNNQLTEQDKEVLLKAITDADKQWNITAFKLERTEKVKKTTAILLEETIEELEQKRKAVETQNRELEIEASLERVRTQAMGMHTLEQLVEVCKAMYTELKTLGFNNIRNAQIAINNDEKGFYLNYEYSDSYSGVIEVFYNSHPNVQALVNEMKKSKDAFFEIEIAGKELNEWRAWRINSGETPDPLLDNATMLCYYFYSVGAGALGISTFDRITFEELNILKRF
jgi:DNA-binding transcriptional MerR regulator